MCTAARGRPEGQRSVQKGECALQPAAGPRGRGQWRRVSLSSVYEERPCVGAGWGRMGSQLGLKSGKPEKELQCKDKPITFRNCLQKAVD